jgi:hypothetical protein
MDTRSRRLSCGKSRFTLNKFSIIARETRFTTQRESGRQVTPSMRGYQKRDEQSWPIAREHFLE